MTTTTATPPDPLAEVLRPLRAQVERHARDAIEADRDRNGTRLHYETEAAERAARTMLALATTALTTLARDLETTKALYVGCAAELSERIAARCSYMCPTSGHHFGELQCERHAGHDGKHFADGDDFEHEEAATSLARERDSAVADAARLRKLFDDAGQGEYNVLALIDHYQDEALRAAADRAALRDLTTDVARHFREEDVLDDLTISLARAEARLAGAPPPVAPATKVKCERCEGLGTVMGRHEREWCGVCHATGEVVEDGAAPPSEDQ